MKTSGLTVGGDRTFDTWFWLAVTPACTVGKSVARWARKLGQQMGEDLGDDWGEMVDKLEAGEDMGDDGMGEPPDPEGMGAGSPDF